MKSLKNLLAKTTELLSSNESAHNKQNKYLPNYKMSNIVYSLENDNKERKSQIEDEGAHTGELDYYKEMIVKMNTDIGDINNRLQSIDNSLSTSILSGNLESIRSINQPNLDLSSFKDKYSNNNPNNIPQYNQIKEQAKPSIQSKIEKLKTPKMSSAVPSNITEKEPPIKQFDIQNDLEEKEKRILALEMNSKLLIEKNKELERQLSKLDTINEPLKTFKTITEPNQEDINITRQSQHKTITTTDNNNQYKNCKTIHTTTTKNDYSLSKLGKSQKKDLRNKIDNKKPYQNQQRLNSAKNKVVKKTPMKNEGLYKGHQMMNKEKISEFTYMLTQPDKTIGFSSNKEHYYENERKQYIEKVNLLESSFNNQIRALNQKYLLTLEKRDSKIKKLSKENEELKLKINQIKSMM